MECWSRWIEYLEGCWSRWIGCLGGYWNWRIGAGADGCRCWDWRIGAEAGGLDAEAGGLKQPFIVTLINNFFQGIIDLDLATSHG